MAEKKVELTSADRKKVWWRSQFLQASWNYERMQNLGWCYAMIPAIKKLYGDNPEEQKAALKRHLEFFNTHPYVAAPVLGVELSLEEDRANGIEVSDQAIQGVKIGMMGPLAGVGDPVFWGTLRPVLGAFAASLALGGSILGAILFFVIWNVIRLAFLYYTQEFGYKQGSAISQDLSGGIMRKITTGASVLGMFIMGVLIERWSSMPMDKVVLSTAYYGDANATYPALQSLTDALNGLSQAGATIGADVINNAYSALTSIASNGLTVGTMTNPATNEPVMALIKTTTLQTVLDSLLPGLLPLLLTLFCIYLLRKKVSPIAIIFGLFAVGILGALVGIF
ncbi:MAG: PTS system mannose/fructose/sorbose family transporter subunit IID [Atopobiaceae bacterium]|jgi:PTS system mannose-specific IID component|nr:PTS system mannose/fructose/sorbose family transporter subunit IID [Atopobiaceae bacterium]MCI2173414.1 PTS system mannose/fructose/sorbose family transporter subunit IID [Atopobiaceae bacterium]MCI2207409.1 PTS system mannose/fructose/sorbose family transporter subunit IID [Atopobiaceae bacterium]